MSFASLCFAFSHYVPCTLPGMLESLVSLGVQVFHFFIKNFVHLTFILEIQGGSFPQWRLNTGPPIAAAFRRPHNTCSWRLSILVHCLFLWLPLSFWYKRWREVLGLEGYGFDSVALVPICRKKANSEELILSLPSLLSGGGLMHCCNSFQDAAVSSTWAFCTTEKYLSCKSLSTDLKVFSCTVVQEPNLLWWLLQLLHHKNFLTTEQQVSCIPSPPINKGCDWNRSWELLLGRPHIVLAVKKICFKLHSSNYLLVAA